MSAKNIWNMLAMIVVTTALSENTLAYDNDVDYSAPYLTVDPETGQLVTVDPKQGTKTPHSPTGPSGTTTLEQTAAPDAEAKSPAYSFRGVAAVSGFLAVLIGGAIMFRKLR